MRHFQIIFQWIFWIIRQINSKNIFKCFVSFWLDNIFKKPPFTHIYKALMPILIVFSAFTKVFSNSKRTSSNSTCLIIPQFGRLSSWLSQSIKGYIYQIIRTHEYYHLIPSLLFHFSFDFILFCLWFKCNFFMKKSIVYPRNEYFQI